MWIKVVLQKILAQKTLTWTILDQAVVSGVNFLTGVLIARALGIQAFGVFSLLWMGVLFLSSIQNAWIIAPMLSLGPKQALLQSDTYYSLFGFQQFLFSVLTALLVAIGLWMLAALRHQTQLIQFVLPVILVCIMGQWQEYLRRYWMVNHQTFEAFCNDLLSYGTQLLGLLTLFYLGHGNTQNVLYIIGLTSMLAVFVGVVQLYQTKSKTLRVKHIYALFKQSLAFIRQQQSFSAWLLASTLCQWASGNWLILTAGALLGSSAVGILKAAQNIVSVSHVLFNALANWVPIQAGRYLAEGGLQSLESFFAKSTLWGTVLTFVLVSPAIFCPKLLLQWVYGSKILTPQFSAEWVLAGYGILYLFMFWIQQVGLALRSLAETRPIFMGYLLTAGLSLLSAPWFIQHRQTIGAVIGLLVFSGLNLAVLLWAYHLKRQSILSSNLSSDNSAAEILST